MARAASLFASAFGRLAARGRFFLSDRRGNVAMLFGLAAIPFFVMGGMAVDFSRAMMVKNRLSTALDATALALGSQVGLTDAQADAQARIYFAANYPEAELGTPSELTIVRGVGTVTISATASVETVVLGLMGVDFNHLTVAADVTVNRSSTNLEVALVVDITGSMEGQKLTDLKAAAKDLINIIVQDEQTPFFSKVALVPYSAAVNVGGFAAAVRGNITRPGSRNITGITRATNATVTSNGHGYQNTERVYISGVNGMTGMNNRFVTVSNRAANTFRTGVNSSSFSAYTSGGTARCASPGCLTRTFTAESGSVRTYDLTSCATERSGGQAYTDAAPGAAPVGLHYAPSSGANHPCPTAQFIPMTSNRAALHDMIDNFVAAGSTAGQIGVAWGWYALSPNFAPIWGGEGAARAYDSDNLEKIAVIMTDGEFNTAYCGGVVGTNSGIDDGQSISGCSPTNGDPFTQAQQLCTAMKQPANGITIYTVGFAVAANSSAATFMQNCASSPSHYKLASNGAELRQAFREIAIEISNLRVSR